MATYSAGEISTNGIAVPVEVDDQTGNWVTTYGGRHLSADTRDKLKATLSRLTKVAKAEVEVHMIEVTHKGLSGIARRRGTATGLHGSNGNVLITWDAAGRRGPVKEQLSGWGGGNDFVAGDVTDEELKHYAYLVIAEAQAKAARFDWWNEHTIDSKEVVQRAIDAHLNTSEE
jgi:hypothetical protein